ncbi:MAG TPA: hypothetical protein VMX76_04055 [Nevskiaceae bacterium]|nr:hypothetical protein [Nevskiaceae bacterium]
MKKKILLILVALFALAGFFFLRPKKISSQIYPSLTSASATLSNSRLSFYGALDVGVSAGATTIVLDTDGTRADESTSHLFPNDTVSVGPNDNFTVGGIIDATTFFLADGLTVGADTGATIYATQSGTLTVAVTTVSDIPANGDIIVTIADPPSGEGNDKAPDSTSSISTNGFDFNGITTANITCPTNWTAESATAGSGDGHTVICNATVGTTGPTALEVAIGVGGTGLINPAAVNVGHTAGVADIYTINVKTRDASNNTKDEVDVKVAPVEAVLVSATVDETLSFTVAGRGAGTTSCGKGAATGIVSTATSIPWAVLSSANTFYDTAQQLTVSTNADAGYAVTIEENDQMGKNGKACSGADAGEAVNCIKDTTCDGAACDEDEEDDWETPANNGLGISLEDETDSDAVFQYNVESGGCEGVAATDFCARQIADMAASETKANIMSNTAPVSGSSVYVCYRISISATQPAGYYYNKVKYTCTATF